MAHVHGGGMGVVNLAFRLRRQIKQGGSPTGGACRRSSDAGVTTTSSSSGSNRGCSSSSSPSSSSPSSSSPSSSSSSVPPSRRRGRSRSASSPCNFPRHINNGNGIPPRSRSRTPSWHERFHGSHLPPIREEPNLEREEDIASGPASGRTRARAESLPAPMLPPIFNTPQRHVPTATPRSSQPSSPLAKSSGNHQPQLPSCHLPSSQEPISASS